MACVCAACVCAVCVCAACVYAACVCVYQIGELVCICVLSRCLASHMCSPDAFMFPLPHSRIRARSARSRHAPGPEHVRRRQCASNWKKRGCVHRRSSVARAAERVPVVVLFGTQRHLNTALSGPGGAGDGRRAADSGRRAAGERSDKRRAAGGGRQLQLSGRSGP